MLYWLQVPLHPVGDAFKTGKLTAVGGAAILKKKSPGSFGSPLPEQCTPAPGLGKPISGTHHGEIPCRIGTNNACMMGAWEQVIRDVFNVLTSSLPSLRAGLCAIRSYYGVHRNCDYSNVQESVETNLEIIGIVYTDVNVSHKCSTTRNWILISKAPPSRN